MSVWERNLQKKKDFTMFLLYKNNALYELIDARLHGDVEIDNSPNECASPIYMIF